LASAKSRVYASGWTGIAILAILLLCLATRLYHLEADPPIDLSHSNDIYTDTGQYTLFARLYLQTGEFNPENDYRFILFLKSSVTALALVVFKLLGIGVWQSNLVGVLYSWGALALFGLFVRKFAGDLTAILFLLFAGLDFSLTFYGRGPFLEHAMAFWAFLALVLCTHFRSWLWYGVAGLSLGVAIFFAKVMGLVFLGPFAALLLYRLKHDDKELPKISRSAAAAFVVGLAALAIFWYFFSYRAMQAQVSGYLEEQTVSLYGTPEALNSFDQFMYKMVTFGIYSELFPRLPVTALLTTVFLGLVGYRFVQRRTWREGLGIWNGGHLFVAVMIVAFYGALMIWNYRPLRYQLVMIYAMHAAAAILLIRFALPWRRTADEPIPKAFYVICFVLGLVPIYQLYGRLVEAMGRQFYYTDFKYFLGLGSIGVTALVVWLIRRYRSGWLVYRPAPAIVIAGVLSAVVVGIGVGNYLFWAQRWADIARDNSRDLAMVVSPEAVLSGPFAPNMTLETRLKAVIHMFGVSKPDPDLFRKFPVTHLLLDEPNEARATEDYPEVMKAATHVATFAIGKNKVRLWRIAGMTGNREASSYPLSLYEQMMQSFAAGNIRQGEEQGSRYIRLYPANMTGNLLLGDRAVAERRYDVAERLFKKAVEFSPTSYVLWVKLARYYRDRYIDTEDEMYKKEALSLYERALFGAPGAEAVFQNEYDQLKVYEAWQLKRDTTLLSQ